MHTHQLADFDIDPQRGFLPARDPLTQLPPYFAAWDALGAGLPGLLFAGKAREHIARLPELDIDKLTSVAEQERALLLLTVFTNAFVWCEPEPAATLPRCIAVPVWRLASALGRKPILHYASNALSNWRRIDPGGDLTLDNLAVLQSLLGGLDEAWFMLVSISVEARGAPALPALLAAQRAVAEAQVPALAETLERIALIMQLTSREMMRMYEKCDPHIFYTRVRPFVAGWPEPGLIYEGISAEAQRFAGGSAAQSSLIQAIDAAIGVRHTHAATSGFLLTMREYMPPKHRAFIETLERGPDIHAFVQQHMQSHPQLTALYNACIEAVADFRRQHMEMAVRYVTLQDPQQKNDLGTGGTGLSRFLGMAKSETRDAGI